MVVDEGWRARWLAAPVALLCAACGGESGGDVTLTVTDSSSSQAFLTGAAVAIDRGDGTREEGVTGGDGTFTAHQVTGAGPFAFTVAMPGYVAVSQLGLTQAGDWQISLHPIGDDPTWDDVGGDVEGKEDASHSVVVSATVPSSRFGGTGPEYTLRVTPGASSLIVCELTWGPAPASARANTTSFIGWSEFPVVVEGPSDFDLALPDLAEPSTAPSGPQPGGPIAGQSLMPLVASGALLVPASMTGATGAVSVTTGTSSWSAFVGGEKDVDVAPDGTDLAYDAQYVMPTTQGDLVTIYGLQAGSAASYVAKLAPPGDTVSFLDPPTLSSPQHLEGPLPVQASDPSVALRVNISRDDSTVAWEVFASPGGSITLPKLPSAINPTLVLGTGRVSAEPEVCEPDPTSGRCARWAVGASADLVSP
jgi:hypothetical protein